METPFAFATLFLAGLAAGVVNVVAGGGSFLTLPILMFLGLPPSVANGTNRIGILLQNVAAVWSFDRHGVLDRRSAEWAAVPALAGAGLGTWFALVIDDESFKRALAVLMVAVSLYSLWRPPADPGDAATPARRNRWLTATIFFGIGIYGGFVQAGVGFFLLAATTGLGLDLVRGNAVKVLTVLTFTMLSLFIFAMAGKVVWIAGLTLGAGTILGGLAGARLTMLKGHAWVRGVVTLAAIAFALKLLVD